MRFQQGRVQLDADFNEQVDITNDALHHRTLDLIGSSGAPKNSGGFEIRAHNILCFDGDDDYAEVGASEDFSFHGHEPFSVEMRVQAKKWERKGTLLAAYDTVGRVWYGLFVDSAGCLCATRGLHGAPVVSEGVDWKQPRQVAMVFDGAELALFVDGEEVAAGASPEPLENHRFEIHSAEAFPNTPVIEGEEIVEEGGGEEETSEEIVLPLTLGFGASLHEGRPAFFFHGSLHSCRIWSVAKSPQELAKTPDCTGLCAGWSLDEGFGDVADDLTPANHTLLMGPAGEASRPSWKTLELSLSAGRFYVRGACCQNDRQVPLDNQRDLPDTPLPKKDGVYLAYLDAWERVLTASHDPQLREVALGGPDTAVRTQRIAQVRLLHLSDDPGTQLAGSSGLSESAYQALVARTSHRGSIFARRNARLAVEPIGNNLYRIQVHHGGARYGEPPDLLDGHLRGRGEIGEDGSFAPDNDSWVPGQWMRIARNGSQHLAMVTQADKGL
ncbi:MAG: hypothetical protein HN348_26465, partial [Proteobacteria bacterium]|nr:hypothetical protein [Pseudomonadota bacterium]